MHLGRRHTRLCLGAVTDRRQQPEPRCVPAVEPLPLVTGCSSRRAAGPCLHDQQWRLCSPGPKPRGRRKHDRRILQPSSTSDARNLRPRNRFHARNDCAHAGVARSGGPQPVRSGRHPEVPPPHRIRAPRPSAPTVATTDAQQLPVPTTATETTVAIVGTRSCCDPTLDNVQPLGCMIAP
jgi:hypothetical protein